MARVPLDRKPSLQRIVMPWPLLATRAIAYLLREVFGLDSTAGTGMLTPSLRHVSICMGDFGMAVAHKNGEQDR
jgi:hypothetical protein